MTGCDTGPSTWGYCSDNFSSWYHEDADSSYYYSYDTIGGITWTYVGGGVCPGGSVSVFNFEEWPAPPEATYYYVGPVRFEIAPAAYTI